MDQKEVVWLVDDESEVTELYECYLNTSMEIRTFVSAEDALNAFDSENAPTVVVSDIRMPGTDGISFLETMRKKNSALSLIILSAHAEKEQVIRANRIRVDEIIEKPCDPLQLKEAIIRACKSKYENLQLMRSQFQKIQNQKELIDILAARMTAAEDFIYEHKLQYPSGMENIAEYLHWQKKDRLLRKEIESVSKV